MLAVGWKSGVEIHLRQEFGAVGAVFPVSGAEPVESHGGVHAPGPCPENGVLQGNPQRVRPGHLRRSLLSLRSGAGKHHHY